MDGDYQNEENEVLKPLMSPPVCDASDAREVELATRIEQDPANNSAYNVTCRVCQNRIDVSNKRDQFVVKCWYCSEATPIQEAPKGKKYVRCSCNCLLVCKTSSQRIACPRANCKRVITLRNIQNDLSTYTRDGMSQVLCAHCRQIFLFNTSQNALARCPHCRKVSSVERQFARGRGMFFLFIGGVLMLLVLIAFLVSGEISQHPARTIFYSILFVVSFFLLVRSLYYCTMKVSYIENEHTPYHSI